MRPSTLQAPWMRTRKLRSSSNLPATALLHAYAFAYTAHLASIRTSPHFAYTVPPPLSSLRSYSSSALSTPDSLELRRVLELPKLGALETEVAVELCVETPNVQVEILRKTPHIPRTFYGCSFRSPHKLNLLSLIIIYVFSPKYCKALRLSYSFWNHCP